MAEHMDEKIVRIIQLYEKEESMWVTTEKDYHDKNLRKANLKKIAEEIPGFTGKDTAIIQAGLCMHSVSCI